MAYFIAAIILITGLFFIGIAGDSAEKVKSINVLSEDERNRSFAKGSLRVIHLRSSRHGFECDAEITFANHKGKILKDKRTFFSLDSKAAFLRDCENKGETPVTVVYDKRSSSNYFVEELKPLEVNANSKIGYRILGILFLLLAFLIVVLEGYSIIMK